VNSGFLAGFFRIATTTAIEDGAGARHHVDVAERGRIEGSGKNGNAHGSAPLIERQRAIASHQDSRAHERSGDRR
jgi:hypothetical protein